MGKTFFKNLFRDIKNTPSRFISIVIIIAVGVAFYSGVRTTSPAMKTSADHYFEEKNFMDFKMISTLGVTDNDLAEIKKQKNIKDAKASYSLDAVIEKDDKQLVINVNSQPEDDGINDIEIIDGRKSETIDEIVVEEHFMKENNLKINDFISLESGNDDNIKDNLKKSKFKIVGMANSPLYLSQQRQISPLGNGDVRGFVYILAQTFKSDVYTEIYARTNISQSKNSLIEHQAYENKIKTIEKDLEDLGEKRNKARYKEVYDDAEEKIIEAEKELEEAKIEAEEEISDGYKKIEDAQREVDNGKKELRENETLLKNEIANGKNELEEGRKEIKSGQEEIVSKREEIKNARPQIKEARDELNESEAQLNQGKQQAANQIDLSIAQEVKNSETLMNSDPENEVYIGQYQAIKGLYEGSIKGKGFDQMYNSLKANNQLSIINQFVDMEKMRADFAKGEAEIQAARSELNKQESSINQGESELAKAQAQIEASKSKISQGESELEKEREEGNRKISNARAELQNAQREIDENLAELRIEEKKANKEIEDGQKEIKKNRDKLKDIEDPKWYVLGRSQNLGYETYRQDSDRIDNIGKVFPLIFFLVAALVSLTTMTRMVQENRTEIGTFKALGYSSITITSHYLIYSLLSSIVGSVLGSLIGFKIFPPLIMEAYSSLYAVPRVITPFITNLAVIASLLAILFTTLAAGFAVKEVLREVPATLMRPKPPKAGKKILLERVNFIWDRLKFTSKVTARNIFRYKQRLFMTVIGIAACTGLMLTGFGLKDGIIGATEAQFNDIYKYDMQGTLDRDKTESEKNEIKKETLKDKNIENILFVKSDSGTIKTDGQRSEDAYVIVPENKDELNDYINLYLQDENLKLNDEGVVITEKLSRLVNKEIGDKIEITIDDTVIEAKIANITEQYIQHYIYMSPGYYEKIMSQDVVYSDFYSVLKDASEKTEDDTSKRLKSIDGINSLSFKSNQKVDYDESMKSIDAVVLILIISAGVLAFVVIYNLTNINITERRRELATIKLLGFYNKELAAYIYRENVILTFLGSFLGLFIGTILNRFVLLTAETNMIKFLVKIEAIHYLYAVLLTLLFSAVVNLAMYKRFDKIDMIESLKSSE